MSKKKPRIVVEYIEGEGLRSRVDHAYSREHAIWMLGQAIVQITTPEQDEVAEVVEDEPVQELPSADGEEEETKLSDLPN